MPLSAVREILPCTGAHQPQAHSHQRVELAGESFDKPCNGRFWCTACMRWYSAEPCRLRHPLRLPASWRS